MLVKSLLSHQNFLGYLHVLIFILLTYRI